MEDGKLPLAYDVHSRVPSAENSRGEGWTSDNKTTSTTSGSWYFSQLFEKWHHLCFLE